MQQRTLKDGSASKASPVGGAGLMARQWSQELLVAVSPEQELLALAPSRQLRSQGLLVAILVGLECGLLVIGKAVVVAELRTSDCRTICGFSIGHGGEEMAPQE
eukprot:g44590.t1